VSRSALEGEAVPEVVGLPLIEAERVLATAGVTFEARETAPRCFGPGEPRFGAEPRVLQQRPAGAGLLLIVAYPLAEPG
jgi:hypothetical protein